MDRVGYQMVHEIDRNIHSMLDERRRHPDADQHAWARQVGMLIGTLSEEEMRELSKLEQARVVTNQLFPGASISLEEQST